MPPLISFVIPAYNAENYIHNCLNSIFSQPTENFEVIIIDDGSTDATVRKVGSFTNRHNNIRLVSQKNSGQGVARNVGISHANGKYIWFVDSDDKIEENVLPRLESLIIKNSPDVVLLNFLFDYGDTRSVAKITPSHLLGRCIDPNDDESYFAAVSCWNTPPWRLLSRREHIVSNNIEFSKGVFYEDHVFAIKLMLCSTKVFIDSPVSYHYYQRADSTTKNNDKKSFDFLQVRKECLSLFDAYKVYDKFQNVVCSYILPLDFYYAHVAQEYQHDFLEKLSLDLLDKDKEFYLKVKGKASVFHLNAVEQCNTRKLNSVVSKWRKLLQILSHDGYRLLIRKISNQVHQSKDAFVRKTLSQLKRVLRSSETGNIATSSHQLYSLPKLGSNSFVEGLYIDVRVNPENRHYVTIGDDSSVAGYFVFERGLGEITIGHRTSIGSGTKIICAQEDGIQIGSNVLISWDCTIIDTNAHSLDSQIRLNDAYDWKTGLESGAMGHNKDWHDVHSKKIIIEDSAWIGFGATILKGVRIGKGAVIGAQSVVCCDVPPHTIYGGNPAKFIKNTPCGDNSDS
ncbi:MAG: glycosyltransferase [Gammaproteobacteria bacterium]|nr:glycosyltransferase [Gammaproteobacteria bacterium]